MISTQLYIYDPIASGQTTHTSYKEVEFFDFESIELVQVKQDVRDISKVFTEFSRTFTIPASKKNNQIFRHFYNPNIYRGADPDGDGVPFDIRKRVDAELHINYKLFKRGRIQIQSTELRGGKPYSYTLIFFGNSVKLSETLGDKTLSSLVALEATKIDYTATNIGTLMNTAQNVAVRNASTGVTVNCADSLLVPLITATSQLVYNSVDNTLDNNLYPHGNQKGVNFRELKPALRVHTIIEAIQAQYSNITFSDDFFTLGKDSSDTYYDNPAYAELFVWLNRNKGQIPLDLPSQQIQSFGVAVGSSEAGMKSNSPQARGDSIQLIPSAPHLSGKTEFFIGVDITAPSATSMYNFVIKKDGKDFQRFDNLFGNQSPVRVESKAVVTSLTPLTFDGLLNSEILGANAPEATPGNYTFYIESANAGQFDFNFTIKKRKPADLSVFGTFKTTRTIAYTGTITVDTDYEFAASNLLSNDMRIIDFLGGLFKMFNLTVVEGSSGELVIKTLDSFYRAGSDINVTQYIDNTKSTLSSALPYSEVEFKYDGLDTVFAEQFGEKNGRTWGTSVYPGETPTENSELLNIGEKYEVIVPFEHQQFNRLWDKDDTTDENNKTSVQWGYSVDGSFNSYMGKPLLFYPILQSGSGINPIEVVVSSSTSVSLSSYYIPSNSVTLEQLMAKSSTETMPTPNIHFNAEENEYTFTPFLRTLFLEYYENYIKQTFDVTRRLYTMKAILPSEILYEISLNDTLIIFDTEYKINKMTTNLSDGRTRFELLNKTVDELLTDNVRDLAANVSGSIVRADNSIVTVDLSQQIT